VTSAGLLVCASSTCVDGGARHRRPRIFAIDDFAYRRGPLLADVAPVHAGTAVSAAVMTGLAIVGLVNAAMVHVSDG